jgi:hypothetical protein
VLAQELGGAKRRTDIGRNLKSYQQRRLIRSAAVQGLSRFASDIIIRGFDTPTKMVWEEGTLLPRVEHFNYAGIVTRILQPILPIFFAVQFNFCTMDHGRMSFLWTLRTLWLLLQLGASCWFCQRVWSVRLIGLEAFIGAEGVLDFEAVSTAIQETVSL